MIMVQSTTPDASPAPYQPTLAELSRNASVISSSSSSSSSTSLVPPPRPQPIRTFSAPRASSPSAPATPRASRPPPPVYLRRDLGVAQDSRLPANGLTTQPNRNAHHPDDAPTSPPGSPPRTRAHSRVRGSRNSSAGPPPAGGTPARISAQDFDFGDVLGEGSYSTVMQARHRNSGNEYAIKVIDKAHLKRNNKLQTALAEKNVLVRLGAGHPGIVRLHWTFQDDWSLYFVLDLAPNGELQSLISRLGSLSLPCSRFYAAQLVDALNYMHTRGVIHRDLKPENVLLDAHMRLKIADFGTGKIVEPGGVPSKTFVGTAQYVSPELLESSETTRASDLWALGCILYQMIAGRFAFQGLSEYLTWQKIKALEYTFPDGFDPDAADLVRRLLTKDPEARLGAGKEGGGNGMEELRRHPFFAGVSWESLWTQDPPEIESGLVKKEPRESAYADLEIESREFAWDDEDEDEEDEEGLGVGSRQGRGSVGFNDLRRADDEMSWAPDALGSPYGAELRRDPGVGEIGYGYAGGGGVGPAHEEGPMGEPVRYVDPSAYAFPQSAPVDASAERSEPEQQQQQSPPKVSTEDSAVEDEDADVEVAPLGAAPLPGSRGILRTGSDAAAPSPSTPAQPPSQHAPVDDATVSFTLPIPPTGNTGSGVGGEKGGRGGSFSTVSAVSTSSSSGQSAGHAAPVGGPSNLSVGGASPVERLGAALMALGRRRPSTGEQETRGRSRDLTPIANAQAKKSKNDVEEGAGRRDSRSPASIPEEEGAAAADSGPAVVGAGNGGEGSDILRELSALLAPGERLVHAGGVESGSLRRRASVLLLPPAMAARKRTTKARTLVLTDRRVLVVKRYTGTKRERAGALGVKAELGLPGPRGNDSGGKEHRGAIVVTGAEARGEKGFTLLTNEKPLAYVAPDPTAATVWIQRLREATDSAQAKP